MNKTMKTICTIVLFLLPGCAHIDFGDKGLMYYEMKPYLFVSTTSECVSTATVVSLPAKTQYMKFVSGYGTADLSATLSNGMIVSVGQKTDTKIPETITAVAGLATAAAGVLKATPTPEKKVECEPAARLYSIVDGKPDFTDEHPFPVKRIDPKK